MSALCQKKHRYSITSSALNNIDDGTVRPRALAVLAFTAISNFTGEIGRFSAAKYLIDVGRTTANYIFEVWSV